MKKTSLNFTLVFVFTTALLVFFSCRQKEQESPKAHKSPNVIFVILDAARADHFSCYDYEKETTPRIDGISRRGALFLNNHSQATHTSSSLPKIFFSRYFSLRIFRLASWFWGIRDESPKTIFMKFDDQQILLMDVLSSNGYRTVFFHDGPWISGNRDPEDVSYGGRWSDRECYMAQKFDESFSFYRSKNDTSEEKIIPAITSWIEKNKERKFFIYCHIYSPHEPYPPKDEDRVFLPGESPSAIRKVKGKFYGRRTDYAGEWSLQDLRILRGLYDSNLNHTDKWIGILYDNLKRFRLENKTVFIITADHGQNLGEHNRLTHGSPPWDSVTHVPLIMVYPPIIPPGVKVTGLTESIDIMPTILDICGIDIPKNKSMDGLSLLDFIENPDKGKESVFTNNSIRTADYKCMVDEELLYDLKDDPGNIMNIAKKKQLVMESLTIKFETAMHPFKERFESSKRERPPDFPFYFPVHEFDLVPKGAFEERRYRGDNINVLKKASPKKPWLLEIDRERFGLFCLFANGPPPPLTLSARLPEGNYKVSMLLESPGKICPRPQELGFRFDTRNPFVFPSRIEFVRKRKEAFFYYLDLGKIEVRNDKFSVQIAFSPPDDGSRKAQPSRSEGLYIIRHIRFDPAGIEGKGVTESLDEEDLIRRMERLESLGYLH